MKRFVFQLATALSCVLWAAVVILWAVSCFVGGRVTVRNDRGTVEASDEVSVHLLLGRGGVQWVWSRSERAVPIDGARPTEGWVLSTDRFAPEPLGAQLSKQQPVGGFLFEDTVEAVPGFRYRLVGVLVPLWSLFLVFGILPAVAINCMLRRRRARTRAAAGLCVRCGYDLRASAARCPECGTEITVSMNA